MKDVVSKADIDEEADGNDEAHGTEWIGCAIGQDGGGEGGRGLHRLRVPCARFCVGNSKETCSPHTCFLIFVEMADLYRYGGSF